MSGIADAEFLQGAFIQEGVSPTPGVLIAACTIGDDYDDPKNRVGVRRQDSWLEFDLSGEAVLSVDATDDGWAYVLGENGTVVRFNWKAPKTKDKLKASRTLFPNEPVYDIGPLRRLRVLGTDILCAGSVGQVYCLQNKGFEALPRLVIGGEDVTIEDIAGKSRNDFIAVTSDGYAAHFNGTVWKKLKLPIQESLSSICTLEQGYGMCGNNGTIIIGSGTRWHALPPLDTERSYWGIATHQGRIYAAHLAGIDKVSGQEVIPLEIKKSKNLQFTVLRSARDGVWSFADHTIGWIHDDRWHTVCNGPPTSEP
ncbi:hypothetical protein JY572_18740 [Myxococcus landrumensis]|uniref:Uncharacterized protein n=2 Tax=Myxococcus landrumensis TaxID=2813577 RepID=A0ABX7NIQ2_9BACT|nr:hypothetical protein JY572_18740 [Myxococcus landrumus]